MYVNRHGRIKKFHMHYGAIRPILFKQLFFFFSEVVLTYYVFTKATGQKLCYRPFYVVKNW